METNNVFLQKINLKCPELIHFIKKSNLSKSILDMADFYFSIVLEEKLDLKFSEKVLILASIIIAANHKNINIPLIEVSDYIDESITEIGWACIYVLNKVYEKIYLLFFIPLF